MDTDEVMEDVRENIKNVGVTDVYEGMEGYVGPTHWAKPYFSNHHHENPSATNSNMLGHVNCSYLSTPGRPPTLEALKQHAQSLTYLISTIIPGEMGAEIDNENRPFSLDGTGWFDKNDAYDWLNNLREPYDNIDKAHRKPLNSLVNLVKWNSDERGVEFHCPLTELPVKRAEKYSMEPVRPFQTHMTLLMHANECLERLDHEYSALGGLLAILPTDRESVNENPDLPKAKSTLIGQWLLYTQHLVGRMHELEIAYANSLDLLASEAIVPAQHMSIYGPDGRSGREIVFPQDRWVLANAGEDVFNFIHRLLDKKEVWLNSLDQAWIRQEVVGESLHNVDDKDEGNLRGIAYIDLSTRFYRLKGSGHGPIFVLPAFADRPNTQYTKEMENRPTVVVLPTPTDPDQTTAWDKSHRGLEKTNLQQTIELSNLTRDNVNLKAAKEAQEDELKRLQHLNRIYEENYGTGPIELSGRLETTENAARLVKAQFDKCVVECNALKKELAEFKRRGEQLPPPDITQIRDDAIKGAKAQLQQCAIERDALKEELAEFKRRGEQLDITQIRDDAIKRAKAQLQQCAIERDALKEELAEYKQKEQLGQAATLPDITQIKDKAIKGAKAQLQQCAMERDALKEELAEYKRRVEQLQTAPHPDAAQIREKAIKGAKAQLQNCAMERDALREKLEEYKRKEELWQGATPRDDAGKEANTQSDLSEQLEAVTAQLEECANEREALQLQLARTGRGEELKALEEARAKLVEERKGLEDLLKEVSQTEATSGDNAIKEVKAQLQECTIERDALKEELAEFKRREQLEQDESPPNVTEAAGFYTMNETAYRQYMRRSNAVLAAQPEIASAKATLEALAKEGHLDTSLFDWMDLIASCD
ncbi:hypothetical protein F5Y06DRAFT_232606 [Hypoxylon sp. FL0890]|nr:hypothetical protein F5Y06DRAFT_232606 [Hypoxylon sp. FL0890]